MLSAPLVSSSSLRHPSCIQRVNCFAAQPPPLLPPARWEGLTFSPTRNEIYTSISEVRYGMVRNTRRQSL